MKKAILLGIAASFFFAFTFILNRQMNMTGGHWIWSASLRYLFMLPLLLIIMRSKSEAIAVLEDIRSQPVTWLTWSTVGFGLFYAPLCLASVYGASWLVAGTWQVTIIAGAVLSPLFNIRIPTKAILAGLVIILGVFLIQLQQFQQISLEDAVMGIVPVVIAAFAYPLGNRKMMQFCEGRFNTFQRVFGMTLASMPFWLMLSVVGLLYAGLPSKVQIGQSFLVAISSGVVATILFFKATELVARDSHKLASVEATQSGEVVFTVIGGMLILQEQLPSKLGLLGLALIVTGMTINSLVSSDPKPCIEEKKSHLSVKR